MALSERTKDAIRVGLASKAAADELDTAVSNLDPPPTGSGWATVTAGAVDNAATAFPTGTGLVKVTAGALEAASVIAANVPLLGAVANVGVGAVDTACGLAVDIDARFETVSDKIDAIIAALVAAGIMSA